MPLQVEGLLDYRFLAFLARPESRSEPVDLGVVATELLKAGVTFTGTGRRRGVHPVQVGDDVVHGSVQTIQVEAVEPGLGLPTAAQPVVVLTLPDHEIQDVGVPPHPGREALEFAQCLLTGRVGAVAPDIPVHLRPAGPPPPRPPTIL